MRPIGGYFEWEFSPAKKQPLILDIFLPHYYSISNHVYMYYVILINLRLYLSHLLKGKIENEMFALIS